MLFNIWVFANGFNFGIRPCARAKVGYRQILGFRWWIAHNHLVIVDNLSVRRCMLNLLSTIPGNLPITFWLLVSDSVSKGVSKSDSKVANPFLFRTRATYWFLGLSLPLPLPWAKIIKALGFGDSEWIDNSAWIWTATIISCSSGWW